ncbi:MAG TPA: hypothetical protein PLU50_00655 [Pseudobdellovibrionaceae bacterium]|nr:hypothetical protein [Pseudobdellovibrionaceae bacterium]
MNMEVLRFYLYRAWFAFKETWVNFWVPLAGYLLFPVFVIVLSQIWNRFHAHRGNFTYNEILIYIGFVEIFYMTFLPFRVVQASAGDFSLYLARPRPFLLVYGSIFFGRTNGSRVIFTAILAVFLILSGLAPQVVLECSARFLFLLIPLAFMQVLYGLLLVCFFVRWHDTKYFMIAIGKVIMIFGGVFSPLTEYSSNHQPWIEWNPFADIFFQPGHFIVKGFFYQISALQWLQRFSLHAIVMAFIVWIFFKLSKKHHQSLGG